ncbi:hypothetical protein SAMN05216483_6805 [Streptomyces sp. 2131.1]|uniref:hypothetical protein n=1 Tax=Streptomyces sp. 2131.1 TaxID=1855346 RepID=UPI00089CA65D|nr:hypothetical protein [Streptomyces sp. 2131.1]SEE85460.1 hypothetical protein SAMN05216483_6805 [Streptomyces sp. 2131.1]
MTATSWTPKLTNVAGVDGTTGTGKYVSANGICTFSGTLVAKKETQAASSAGFGMTLPVPAVPGVRYTFNLEYDGRDADNGVWTGEAMIAAGSDGSKIDRLRVTSGSNGAALLNVDHLYGDAEGAAEAEIITVTGSYPTA